jgi:molybdopterin-guanine dinucleotide biosynthesis protein A
LKISGIVLAGGRSLRLGRNKSLVKISNKNLLDLVISRISEVSSDIIVIIAKEQNIAGLPHFPRARIVNDIFPGKGPLGGIYTGLKTTSSRYNFVVASDMPFLNVLLMRYMIAHAEDADIVLPRVGHFIEPLHAVYSQDCLAPIQEMIQHNDLKLSNLLQRVKVRYVDTAEIERFDPRHLSFFNVNTEADLAKAHRISRGEI